MDEIVEAIRFLNLTLGVIGLALIIAMGIRSND